MATNHDAQAICCRLPVVCLLASLPAGPVFALQNLAIRSSRLAAAPSLPAALRSLELIGALEGGSGALTPLGLHLARMPCDPRIGAAPYR
jgi:hypothetical protein